MGKPTKRKTGAVAKKKASVTVAKSASRQAPSGAWSADTLLVALRRGSDADKVELLREAGILDANGKLSKKYRNWGAKVTRTPDAEDVHA